MVFSSLQFLCLFLPFVVIGFYYLASRGLSLAPLVFLLAACLFFYGYWSPSNTWVIVLSIAFNYLASIALYLSRRFRRAILVVAVGANLAALGYYKYFDFAIETANGLFGLDLPLKHIVLPIGISFFTFQQIAFLVDRYNTSGPPEGGILSYALFISFFPHSIAGPLVHHKEIIPQLSSSAILKLDWSNMYAGMVMLGIGLAKKVLVADSLSPLVALVFDRMPALDGTQAWIGSLAYTMQLYFDFSGYSDMAIGCAYFFNIHFPQNFLSPYQSPSIQEFWRRWHITLSRWLRDYLYIPFGGNRRGQLRTLANLFATFLLGGLWHGAAWTFIVWGAMHGLGLCANRVWSTTLKRRMPFLLGWLCTFLYVNAAWVLFRAHSFGDAVKVYKGMLGLNGWGLDLSVKGLEPLLFGLPAVCVWGLPFAATGIALLTPNATAILGHGRPRRWLSLWVAGLGAVSLWALGQSNRISEFIYFQF